MSKQFLADLDFEGFPRSFPLNLCPPLSFQIQFGGGGYVVIVTHDTMSGLHRPSLPHWNKVCLLCACVRRIILTHDGIDPVALAAVVGDHSAGGGVVTPIMVM